MAEIILAAIDQKRARGNEVIILVSFKTPLTYRWLTRFRSMLSSAFPCVAGVFSAILLFVPSPVRAENRLRMLRYSANENAIRNALSQSLSFPVPLD